MKNNDIIKEIPKLVLASASPRRAALLKEHFKIPFEILPSSIEEDILPDEDPIEYAKRIALKKAEETAKNILDPHQPTYVLGADTIVVIDQEILVKPKNALMAFKYLERLSGKTHQVMTGYALLLLQNTGDSPPVGPANLRFPAGARTRFVKSGLRHLLDPPARHREPSSGRHPLGVVDRILCNEVSCSEVTFKNLSKKEIWEYIETGEPMDKAGAYAIQGRARKFVEQVKGSTYNVVGLPVEDLKTVLNKLGF